MQPTEADQGEPTNPSVVTPVDATPVNAQDIEEPIHYEEPIQYDEPKGEGEEVKETGVIGRTITAYKTESVCTALVGGIFIASCVELAQAAEDCQKTYNDCEDEDGYAVAVGCISLILCLIYFIFYQFVPGMVEQFNRYAPLFFFVWWACGTVVMTFDRPFSQTGNGYFACWGAAIMSLVYCQITMARFKVLGEKISGAIAGSQERKLLMLVMMLSFVVAFAALVLWDDLNIDGGSFTEKQTSQETWAFAAGIVSGGIAAVYLILEMCKPGMLGGKFLMYFSWFLVPWWMFGAGVSTFDAPFPNTGNGYFCAWGAFLSSCYLAYCTTMTMPSS